MDLKYLGGQCGVAGSPPQQTPLECNYLNEQLLHISQDQVPRQSSE